MSGSQQTSVGTRFCEATKLGLAIAGGINNQSFLRQEKVGLVQALLDERNYPLMYQQYVNNGFHDQVIKIPRLQRSTEDQVISSHTCEPGSTQDYTEQQIDVRDFYSAQISFQVTEEQLVGYCNDVNAITTAAGSEAGDVLSAYGETFGLGNFRHFNDVLNKIAVHLNGLRSKINRDVAAKLVSSLGVNIATGNNTPFSIPLLNLSDFSKREEALHIMNSHSMAMLYNGGYFTVGAGNLLSFVTSLNYGCCNSNGLDWDAVNSNAPFVFYLDGFVPQEGGDDNFFLALPFGETQFVYRNRALANASNDLIGKGIARGTIGDPLLPGVEYDIEVRHIDCVNDEPQDVYEIFIRLRYDVIITPEFSFSASDRMYGYNGVLGYIGTAV